MKLVKTSKHIFWLVIMSVVAPCAFGAGAEITSLDAVSDGDVVRITIGATSPVTPRFWALDKPSRLIFDFPRVAFANQVQRISVNHAGVGEVRMEMNHGASPGARLSVDTDRLPRFAIKAVGNRVMLTIYSQPWTGYNHMAKAAGDAAASPVLTSANNSVPPSADNRAIANEPGSQTATTMIAAVSTAAPP